jgi:soluble lytic murein transglycosylase
VLLHVELIDPPGEPPSSCASGRPGRGARVRAVLGGLVLLAGALLPPPPWPAGRGGEARADPAAPAGPARAPASAPTQGPPRRPSPFRAEWLEPYLASGVGGRAKELFFARRPAEAVPLLRRWLEKGGGKGKEREPARYLLAQALLESGQPGAAEKLFAELEASYPLLLDHHLYYGALALRKAGRHAEAEARAGRVGKDSVLAGEAALLRADALYAMDRRLEAAKLYAEHVASRAGGGGRSAEARLRIAQSLLLEAGKAAPGRRGAGEEKIAAALGHLKRILVDAPLSSQAKEAEKLASGLTKGAPKRAALVALTVEERLERAMVLFRAQRNKEAEAAFAELLKAPGLPATSTPSPTPGTPPPQSPLPRRLECKVAFHLARSVTKQRDPARAVPLYEAAEKACRQADESDLVVKSLFEAGKGLVRRHEHDQAIAKFGAIEKEFPSHSYADDARLWAAEAAEAAGQRDEVTRLLSTLPGLYPRGDMAREALWRLAKRAIVEGKPEEARRYLDRTIDELGPAKVYYAEGQALYFRARLSEKERHPKEAARDFERCIREYPLSYYSLLSYNRLREAHPALGRRLEAELVARAGKDAGRFAFEPRVLFSDEGFLRGVELARLGFAADAERELARAGLRVKAKEPRADLWLAAVIYDRAGLYKRSHQVGRSLETSYRRSWPVGENRRPWSLAYPRAFAPIVRASAKSAKVPESLVLSVMREESGFETEIESYANALGLMQLILPTARTAGASQKVEVTRERLRDPAVNIRLGATFLGFLYRAFSKELPLVIASYNAGEGATQRWLKEFGRVPLDEFVERIPFDQTRRYTKRVLATYFAYSVLYGQEPASRIPKIGLALPRLKGGAVFGKEEKAKRAAKKKRAGSEG